MTGKNNVKELLGQNPYTPNNIDDLVKKCHRLPQSPF
jgi:hypothetical protein